MNVEFPSTLNMTNPVAVSLTLAVRKTKFPADSTMTSIGVFFNVEFVLTM